MDEKSDIHALEVVRRIRDDHAELLKGKSNEEIIEFFHSRAEAFRKRARTSKRRATDKRRQAPASKQRRS